MNQTQTATQMLSIIPQPAFCAENGIIIAVNQYATQLSILPDSPVTDLLVTGKEAYATFTGGCLYLLVGISNANFGASVTKVGNLDVFTLENEASIAQLRSYALAAREIRKPLSGMITLAESLFPVVTKEGNPLLCEQVSQMNRNLNQLQRLVGNMSDALRYTNPSSVHPQVQNVTAFLQELMEKLSVASGNTDLTFRYRLPQTDIYCAFDEALLERAIYNLISNAFKFTEKKGWIEFRASQENGYLQVVVINSGNIMNAVDINSIFTRYQRTPMIEDSRNGIGLGLVLCRTAALAHGGTMLIEQQPKEWTKVVMTLSLSVAGQALRSPIQMIDYAGERSHLLIELSDALSSEEYKIPQK